MGQLWWDKANYTCLAVQTAKETAFREAEIDLKDVDFAGLYDCFTAEVLFQLEDYGWCKKGEGGAFVEGGASVRGARSQSILAVDSCPHITWASKLMSRRPSCNSAAKPESGR